MMYEEMVIYFICEGVGHLFPCVNVFIYLFIYVFSCPIYFLSLFIHFGDLFFEKLLIDFGYLFVKYLFIY